MTSIPTAITLTLTPDEIEVLQMLSTQYQVEGMEEAVHALLRHTKEEIEAEDAMWDDTFARSIHVLDRLAQQALEDDKNGLVVDLEFDDDGNLV